MGQEETKKLEKSGNVGGWVAGEGVHEGGGVEETIRKGEQIKESEMW